MSPDIEWRIEDDSGQRTVSSPPRVARPRRWAFAAVIVTGLVCFYLGVFIAQPRPSAPLPTPLVITRVFTQPAATITPELLTEAIRRDALALDPRSLIVTSTAHLDAVYAAWYRSLLQVYGPIEPAYTIIQSGTLANEIGRAHV